MKTIQEELKELSAIMDTTTNESDTRYQDKFLYIRGTILPMRMLQL